MISRVLPPKLIIASRRLSCRGASVRVSLCGGKGVLGKGVTWILISSVQESGRVDSLFSGGSEWGGVT